MSTSARDLYAAYVARCEAAGSLPLKQGSFKNKAEIIAATDDLPNTDEPDDAGELVVTELKSTADTVVIGVALTKVQRATLRREFTRLGLARPDGWRGATIPVEVAAKIGLA